MERLGADAHLLQQFEPLSREDIQASTAIINPNEPRSSTLQLSWICSSILQQMWARPRRPLQNYQNVCHIFEAEPLSVFNFLWQFSEFIGCMPGHKKIGGQRK